MKTKRFLSMLLVLCLIMQMVFFVSTVNVSAAMEERPPVKVLPLTLTTLMTTGASSGTSANAKDGNNATYWESTPASGVVDYWKINLGAKYKIEKIEIVPTSTKTDLSNFYVVGANVEWDTQPATPVPANWNLSSGNSTKYAMKLADSASDTGFSEGTGSNDLWTADVTSPANVQYIKVYKKSANAKLGFAEIKIYVDASYYNNIINGKEIKVLAGTGATGVPNGINDNSIRDVDTPANRWYSASTYKLAVDLGSAQRVDKIYWFSRPGRGIEIEGFKLYGSNDSNIMSAGTYSTATKYQINTAPVVGTDVLNNGVSSVTTANEANLFPIVDNDPAGTNKFRYYYFESLAGGLDFALLQRAPEQDPTTYPSSTTYTPQNAYAQIANLTASATGNADTSKTPDKAIDANSTGTAWVGLNNTNSIKLTLGTKDFISALKFTMRTTGLTIGEQGGYKIEVSNDDSTFYTIGAVPVTNYSNYLNGGVYYFLNNSQYNNIKFKYVRISPTNNAIIGFGDIKLYKDPLMTEAFPTVTGVSIDTSKRVFEGTKDFEITFSKDMDSSTLNSTNITVTEDGSPVSYTGSMPTTSSFKIPLNLISGKQYVITVTTNVKDAYSLAVASPTTYTFTPVALSSIQKAVYFNAARGKPAYARTNGDSTIPPSTSTAGLGSTGWYSSYASGNYEYWYVDLGTAYTIRQIRVVARYTNTLNESANCTITGTNTLDGNNQPDFDAGSSLVTTPSSITSVTSSYMVADTTPYKYVRIRRINSNVSMGFKDFQVMVDPTAVSIPQGGVGNVSAQIDGVDETANVTWTSSNCGNATIGSSDGRISALRPGTTVITATQGEIVFSATVNISAASALSAKTSPDIFASFVSATAPAIASTISTDTTNSNYTLKRITYNSTPKSGTDNVIYAVLAEQKAANSPGVLILHGGGQNVDETLVKKYADAGYNVVMPEIPGIAEPKSGANYIHPESSGTWKSELLGTRQINLPDNLATSSSLYEGIVASIQAFKLLKTSANIDAYNLGVRGLSWGGYTALMVSSLLGGDVKAAYSYYGTGFYDRTPYFKNLLDTRTPTVRDNWLKDLDASQRLGSLSANFYLVSPTNDTYFSAPAANATIDAINGGNKNIVYVANQDHNATGLAGDNGVANEMLFFEYLLKGTGAPLPKVTITSISKPGDGTIKVDYSVANLQTSPSSKLYYSMPDKKWDTVSLGRTWSNVTATVNGNGTYTAIVPANVVTANGDWYVTAQDGRNAIGGSKIYACSEDLNILSISKNGNSVSAVCNTSYMPNATLIVALYNVDKLVDVKIISKNANEVQLVNDISTSGKTVTLAKTFIFSDMTSIKPLYSAPSVIIP